MVENGEVSDEELRKVFQGTDFGVGSNSREIVAETLLKISAGFSTGHTALVCCQELGLLGKSKTKPCLTKKGRLHLYFAHKSRPAKREEMHEEAGLTYEHMRRAAERMTAALKAENPHEIYIAARGMRILLNQGQADEVQELRAALHPFAEMAPAFREWRYSNLSFPIQSAHPPHVPVLHKQWPADEITVNFRLLYVSDFERAAAAINGKVST